MCIPKGLPAIGITFGLVLCMSGLPNLYGQSFVRIESGDIVNDGGISAGVSWGDYDGDGFVDLFVTNWQNQRNFLIA